MIGDRVMRSAVPLDQAAEAISMSAVCGLSLGGATTMGIDPADYAVLLSLLWGYTAWRVWEVLLAK